ncbi:MAG: OmpA family protein [Parvularculaceae bacterium]
MARRDERYDDGRGAFWVLVVLLLLIIAGALFLWRWWNERADEEFADTQPAPVEESAAAPVVEPEPEIIEPAPIEEPEPPVPEAVIFTVYFDLMKSNLTEAAAAEIDAALAGLDSYLVTSVRIDGYADTAGTDAYNLPLSARRAEAVRSYLLARGAPEGRVVTAGHGETGLALPTADGVREPLNRRAEVEIRFD